MQAVGDEISCESWLWTVLLSGTRSLCVIGPLVPDDIGRFYPLSTGFGSVPDLLACVAALAATSVRCRFGLQLFDEGDDLMKLGPE